MNKAIIMGASSGIGWHMAQQLLQSGWQVGVASRREAELVKLEQLYPGQVTYKVIDVTHGDAAGRLIELIRTIGGIRLYIHSSGVGHQNLPLAEDIELGTVNTNGQGFTRCIGAVYRYMEQHGGGQIAAISSIAGVRGLGVAPAYSATKAFQATYLQALRQQARLRGLHICITDIRPGFVATALLGDGQRYPMQMCAHNVARQALRAIMKRRRVAIIDWRYCLLVAFWRLIPDWLWVRMRVRT